MLKSYLSTSQIVTACWLSVILTTWTGAQSRVYESLPIKEVTAFKDGHAFVLHEGLAARDAEGRVVLDYLPSPVMGTFWAYCAEPGMKLMSVVTGETAVDVNRPAVSVLDLIKANPEQRVIIKEHGHQETYTASAVRVLEDKNPDTTQANDPTLLLHTEVGIKVIPISRIEHLVFPDAPHEDVAYVKKKGTMTLQLDGVQTDNKDQVHVGMTYIQKGLRWIPSYRINIDGDGRAKVLLQATLVNDLADLNDVTAHLVVGVPRFVLENTVDPISLQQTMAQVAAQMRPGSQTQYAFSNAIMSQRVNMEAGWGAAADAQNPAASVQSTEQAEDHFVFSVKHVTLAQGQRMVLPLAEFELNYEDVYLLTIPFSPPLELCRNFNMQQQLEIAHLFENPTAMHALRMKNQSDYPLTTGPALILKSGMVLGQGLVLYTAIGNTCDLEITKAVNIKVKPEDQQDDNESNGFTWNGSTYARTNMIGTLSLVNYQDKPIHLEIKRHLLGIADQADHDGKCIQLGHGFQVWGRLDNLPVWWNWCNWPWWWTHLNSLGTITWDIELEPRQEYELNYTWHYFWKP